MDYFNFNQVYSFIDRNGRYSYINQSNIMAWNLARLADTLLPIIKYNYKESDQFAVNVLEKELAGIKEQFDKAFNRKIQRKLGLDHEGINELTKSDLIADFFKILSDNEIDFTSSFRKLSSGLITNKIEEKLNPFFNNWKNTLNNANLDLKIVSAEINLINPVIIPRNHMVEKMINLAISGDFSLFNQMIEILKDPFQETSFNQNFSLPPSENEIVANTFCGT